MMVAKINHSRFRGVDCFKESVACVIELNLCHAHKPTFCYSHTATPTGIKCSFLFKLRLYRQFPSLHVYWIFL